MDKSENIYDETAEGMSRRDALRTGAAVAAGVVAITLPAASVAASVGGSGGGGGYSYDFIIDNFQDVMYSYGSDPYYITLPFRNVSGVTQSIGGTTAFTDDGSTFLYSPVDITWSGVDRDDYESGFAGDTQWLAAANFAATSVGSPLTVLNGAMVYAKIRVVSGAQMDFSGNIVVAPTVGGTPSFQPQPTNWWND